MFRSWCLASSLFALIYLIMACSDKLNRGLFWLACFGLDQGMRISFCDTVYHPAPPRSLFPNPTHAFTSPLCSFLLWNTFTLWLLRSSKQLLSLWKHSRIHAARQQDYQGETNLSEFIFVFFLNHKTTEINHAIIQYPSELIVNSLLF